jgi:hypothetical protein
MFKNKKYYYYLLMLEITELLIPFVQGVWLKTRVGRERLRTGTLRPGGVLNLKLFLGLPIGKGEMLRRTRSGIRKASEPVSLKLRPGQHWIGPRLKEQFKRLQTVLGQPTKAGKEGRKVGMDEPLAHVGRGL